MTKNELASRVAKTTGIEKKYIDLVIDDTIKAIRKAVAEGDSVFLRGFGTFKPQFTNARTARNLAQGGTMYVSAHYTPKFKPGKAFKEEVGKLNDGHPC